jgi:signal peptidase I
VPNTFKQTGLSALAAPGGVPLAATVGALPVTLLRRRRKLRKLARRAAVGGGESDRAAK